MSEQTTTDWTSALPEETKAYVANKGWTDPAKAVESYVQLEKFMGAEKAGRGIVMPGEHATPEELNAFYGKLGKPAEVNGYEIKLPDGFPDPEFGKVAPAILHKHNLTKAQGEALLGDFAGMVMQGQQQRMEQEQAEFAKQETALKTEWGDQFDRNTEIAKRGAKKLGFSDEVIDQLEMKSGFAGVIKALHNAGMLLGEGQFVDSGFATKGAETLDALTAKRAALSKDADFGARFNHPDVAVNASAKAEWKDLEDKIAAARKRA